jgi:hypothetical protein
LAHHEEAALMDFPFQHEPGWHGAFTRGQAPGAIPNGRRIVKTATEDGDTNPLGTMGTVLGSLSRPEVLNGALMYFVEWDTMPRVAVGVIANKIGELS